jgi:hypothetical protein
MAMTNPMTKGIRHPHAKYCSLVVMVSMIVVITEVMAKPTGNAP